MIAARFAIQRRRFRSGNPATWNINVVGLMACPFPKMGASASGTSASYAGYTPIVPLPSSLRLSARESHLPCNGALLARLTLRADEFMLSDVLPLRSFTKGLSVFDMDSILMVKAATTTVAE